MSHSSTDQNGTSESTQAVWQQDLLASLVVFLVALPLCMGIALASGAPVAAGLVTGIVGGLLVGTFAGSPLQVSGPAAGLTVICGEIIRQNGMQAFGLAVLFAGVFQLVAGICRLGQWFRAVSPAVIHGMLSGIGILILCGQLHVLVDERPRETAMKNIAAIPESLATGLAMPTWDSPEIRHARIDLLRMSNALGTRQRTLRGDVERSLNRLKSTEVQDELEELPAINPTLVTLTLKPFQDEQKAIAAELDGIMANAAESAIIKSGGAAAETLMTQLKSANEKLQVAEADLEGEAVEAVVHSQKDASLALEKLTAGLKSHDWAGKIGLLAVLVIFVWQFLARGKLKLIPAPLLAIVVATTASQLLQAPILYVDVPGNLLSGLTMPTADTFSESPLKSLLIAGAVLAIVASAETLLCATAVDQMHRGPRTRYDRELSAQGVGNIVCGCLGVLPMTGVIVRSAANVQAGGKTRLSAILHGLWLLLFSVVLAPVLRLIPTAALAGILVFTGFRLIDFKGFFHLWRENRIEAAIFLITMIVIVVDDLLTGVITGIVLSAVKLLARFSQLDVEVDDISLATDGPKTVIKLVGAATFLRLPKLASRLEKVPAGADLHVDVSEMDYIDRACMELLQNWSRQHAATGGRLTIDWDLLNDRFQTRKSRPGHAT